MVLDKVLSDERTTAYASDIEDINYYWSECKECNWYKSKRTILSEARVSIQNIIEFYYDNLASDKIVSSDLYQSQSLQSNQYLLILSMVVT